jgi:hypothetical protein
MSNAQPLKADKKLSVTYRIEPGCLGPEGDTHVVAFCDVAQKAFEGVNANYINWCIEPRDDKSLPEMEYSTMGKKMSDSQADKYLTLFDQGLDAFEMALGKKMAALINEFMGH